MGILHLPNGHTVTVSPVYGGLYFKTNDLVTHQTAFPAGWTIVLHSEEMINGHDREKGQLEESDAEASKKHVHVHRYRTPTRQTDALFISSISNPSSSDFKPAVSPTRQIAMMLWATLSWYFHQVRCSFLKNTDLNSHDQSLSSAIPPRSTYQKLEGQRANGAFISNARVYSKDVICFPNSKGWA